MEQQVLTVLESVAAYLVDARMHVVAVLMVLDVLFGIWSSIQSGEFDWKKVGQFYKTNVVPYIGGYLTVYVAADFVPSATDLISEGIKTLLWAPLVANLVGSVVANLRSMGIERGEE
jgi:hypothetical protein